MRKSWKKFRVGSARCCRTSMSRPSKLPGSGGGGKKEKYAMITGFDDATDKADCTTMYEAGLVLLEKMQVSSYIP